MKMLAVCSGHSGFAQSFKLIRQRCRVPSEIAVEEQLVLLTISDGDVVGWETVLDGAQYSILTRGVYDGQGLNCTGIRVLSWILQRAVLCDIGSSRN